MSGNVSEWCYDWHGTVYSSTSDTGESFGSCRVLRGDSWYGGGFNCQVSSRNYGDPYKRYATCGFRVVRSSSKGNSGTPVMQTVATPAFSVASGAVVSGTEVTISCSTEGAKIYYTTDGSEPTASSTEYTSAISVTAVVTLKAIAVKSGMNDSAVASVSYTIKVATPAFSVASGAVDSGTEVTITCATEGAKIYYTTDGTEPTAESTEYTVAISVTEAVTLKVIAVKSGMNDSVVASVSYTISSGNIPEGFVELTGTTITGNESWTPSSEVFVSGRSITIPDMYVCDHEVTRGEFKEVMGTDPSTADAYDKDGNELTGDAVLNNPVNDVNWYDAIAYCNKLSLKENLTPCYSVSGVTDWENLAYSSIPTTSDTNWDAAVCDFEADGYRLPTEAEWEWLARGGENYFYAGSNTIDDVAWYEKNTSDTGTREVKTKKANGYGLYDMSGNVDEWCYDWYDTVSSNTADTGASSGSYRIRRGGSWYYGGNYCQVSNRNCRNPGDRDDDYGFRVVRSSSKGNSGTPVMQTVAIPEFSIASGAVDSGTEVTISCSTEGAKIYYTTDGSEPTASSTEYTSAISITEAVTVKAIAVKDGMNNSAVASVSYTISSGNIPVELVKVKGGTVTGKSNTNNYDGVFIEGRTVTLSDFYMSKYEVTKAQYKAIMEDTTLNTLGITADPSYSTLQPKTYVMAAGEEDYERPVENVTWYDAVYFCNLMSQKGRT